MRVIVRSVVAVPIIATLIVALFANTQASSPGPGASSAPRPLPPTDCPSDGPLASGTIATIAGDGTADQSPDAGPALATGIDVTVGGIALDAEGAVLFTGYNGDTVWRVGTDGTLSAFAGPGTGAPFVRPMGLAFDRDGALLTADTGAHRIWMVASDGTITAIAGTGVEGSDGDGGPATEAQINAGTLAVGPAGDVYLDDVNRFRAIDPAGIIDAFAGTGIAGFSGDGGPARDAQFGEDIGVAADADGNVYMGDTGNLRIRKVDSAGTITTFAGSGTMGFTGDGGPAIDASLDGPVSFAIDTDGSIYFSDHHNHAVRRIDPAGVITTVAGTGQAGYSGDCGPATEAQLAEPWGIAVRDGVLYIVDMGNQRIRIVVP